MGPTIERRDLLGGYSRSVTTGSSFFLGMILFALGILGLVLADVVTVASIIVFGAILAIGGFTESVGYARRQREGDRFSPAFLSGVLSTAVGLTIVFRPEVGVTASGLLITGWLFASGLFRGLTAVIDRYRNWGWDLFYGFISIVLGGWLIARLPTSATWLLGTVISIELMVRGVAIMGASRALRRLERASIPAT